MDCLGPIHAQQKYWIWFKLFLRFFANITQSMIVDVQPDILLKRMVKGTKSIGVTINDFLLAGYAETIVQMGRQKEIIIPVPADIRTYCKDLKGLTIANMTGKYQCPIRWEKGMALVQLSLIHI